MARSGSGMLRFARVRKQRRRINEKEKPKSNPIAKSIDSPKKVEEKTKALIAQLTRRPTRERKPTKIFTIVEPERKKRRRVDPTEKNVDECVVCKKKGLLLCCENYTCTKSFHLGCLNPPLAELPEGTWFCDECHDKQHDDVCDVCGLGGELLCCDRCSLAYHTKCVGLDCPPEGHWECRRCKTPVYTPNSGKDNIDLLTKNFQNYGLCIFKSALNDRQVGQCLKLTLARLSEAFDTVRRLGLEQELIDVGFATFKTRSRNRYDLRIPEFTTRKFNFLNKKAKWLPLVKAILGKDIKIVHTGVMMSMPGSETQPYHMDGPHLSDKKHLPPHCLNVFVPLVNLTPEVGPTEFVPTSHILHNYWDPGVKPMTLNATCGQCILFDYRIKHRGLGNRSDQERPVIYITYAHKSFKDVKNFSQRRYKQLPKLKK